MVAIAVVGIMLVGAAGPAVAHSWQTTVKQGPMELGVSSSPETPVAGMQAEFSARIADDDPAGDADRLDWGGVTNQSVEVHIRGPDDYHDHVKAEIPEEEAHFHWTYVFPTDGTYSIAVVTELEGQEYAFQFQKNVTLMPAKATGEEMAHLSEEIHTMSEDVESTNEKVDSLQSEVEELNSQVSSLQSQLENQAASDHDDGTSQAQLPGFTALTALMAVITVLAFVAGRRYAGREP